MNAARDTIESRMGRIEFTMMISMIMVVTALAIDMMLPAFGAMRTEFGLASDSNAVALIVTFFFLGLVLGQPVFGPFSDALGRKRVLYIGLAIYVIASIGTVFAPSLPVLLALRFVAGVGAAGPSVVARGIVRDAYEGQAMAKVMSYVMAVFIVVPVIAPTLGAIILSLGTWQLIFWFFSVFGIGVGLWSRKMPETLPPDKRLPLSLGRLTSATGTVLRSRFTMGLTFAQEPPFWLFLAGVMPILFGYALLIPNLNAAAMIPMGDVAGTAAAVIGTISILGGASVGALIDIAYNGTIIPLATAGLIGCTVATGFFIWSERVWDDIAPSPASPVPAGASANNPTTNR